MQQGVAAKFHFVIFLSLENFSSDQQHLGCWYDVTISPGSLSAIIFVQLGGTHRYC